MAFGESEHCEYKKRTHKLTAILLFPILASPAVPFGSGPRLCLGMHLAYHEAKLIVRRFITQYKIEYGANFVDPLPLKCSTVFINPLDKVEFKFTPLK